MPTPDIFFWDDEESSTNPADTGSQIATWDITFADDEEDIQADPAPVVEEVTTEITTEELTTPETGDEEIDLDISALLDDVQTEIDESNKQLDKIEESATPEVAWEIGLLRDSLSKMNEQLKKLNKEKVELQFENAELQAFGFDQQDPKMVSLVRLMKKAKDGDDASKDKTVRLLKDMLYEFTGQDYEEAKINSDIDLLTSAELYNSQTNPNLSSKKDDDDGFAM